MTTTIQLSPSSRAPQLDDTLVWAGEGWELRPFPLPPSAIREIHTNTIMRIAMGQTRSPNFAAGASGWCIYPDGSAEFNDIVARGTIYATAGVIGGWAILPAYLAKDTGTNATSAGMAPLDFPFYAGATYANRAAAPFRVTPAGAIVATSGTIGGWSIAAAYIAKDTGLDATSAGMAPSDYPFYAGTVYANRAAAPFRVTTAGALYATGATITGTLTATTGSIGGWTINATSLTGGNATLHSTGYLLLGTTTDIVRIDAADVLYRIWVGAVLGADAPFSVTKAGALKSTSGEIAGWTINAAYLAKDTGVDATSAGLAPTDVTVQSVLDFSPLRPQRPLRERIGGLLGRLERLFSTNLCVLRVLGGKIAPQLNGYTDFPFYAGAVYAGRATAPFRVTPAGALVATSATISGSITATTGTIGGWAITATQIKAAADVVILDSAGIVTVGGAGYLTSNPFTGGAVGWRITPAGAEFGNITARGEISTCVLTYNEVHVNAGILLVAPRAGKLASQLTVAANGSFDIGEAGRLLVNDIVRLKDSTYDRWLTVTADNGDGTYNYTLSSGAAGAVFNPGTAVASYGPSGAGGLMLNAVGPNGPFMDIFTHAGSPWTTLTTKVRVGNLAGIVDTDLNPTGYGFYSDNAYLKGDLVAGGGKVFIDNTGVHIDIEGSIPSSGRIVFEDFDATYDFWAMLWTYASGSAYKFSLRNRAATATYTTAVTNLTAEGPAATAETVSEVYLSAPTGWSGLRAAAGTYAMVGVWDGATTVVRPKTTWNSGGNIVHKLFDAAGANKLQIVDSAEVEVAYVDSNGNARFIGQLALPTSGASYGILCGGDVQWYRMSANLWRTPDSVTVDVGLNVGSASGATTGQIKASGDMFALGKAIGLQAQIYAQAIYDCTGTLDLSTAWQDVAGCTTGSFTPDANEYALVNLVAVIRFDAGTAACNAGDNLQAVLAVNGVAEATVAGLTASGNTGAFCTSKWYRISLNASTAYILKMQAKNLTGNRGRVSTSTHMLVWRIAR